MHTVMVKRPKFLYENETVANMSIENYNTMCHVSCYIKGWCDCKLHSWYRWVGSKLARYKYLSQ